MGRASNREASSREAGSRWAGSRWARIGAAATALLLLGGCHRGPGEPPFTPPNEFGAFAPGGEGLGDPYYPRAGNTGYDVVSYDLDLRYDPGSDKLTGSATITATATTNLSRFNLDLRALEVEQATVDGTAAEHYQYDDELTLTPKTGIAKGSRFVAKITYGGEPSDYEGDTLGVGGFLHTRDGAVAIGEPEVAAAWFPVNDHPRDKATYTVRISAPDGLAAISNGALKGKTSAEGYTTWTWVESKPMAPYLATIVIGRYRVQEGVFEGKPVFMAVEASLLTNVDTEIARTPEIVDFLETQFGPYPFDALGGIVIGDGRIRYALENQSRPIYGFFLFGPGQDPTQVMVHELAHQWFGDSVSVREWRDIWLNEGFATYAEWLWAEKSGTKTTQRIFDEYYADPTSEMWQVPPGSPGRDALFHRSVYTRGAMTLQALRVAVGDDAFFSIIRTWATENAGRNATTDEFIALAEKISSRQLDRLFQEWLYGAARPALPQV